ncbi:hypothetical protein K2X30_11175 [bacterium]|nr:hypothetical protein [bacterium]
MYPVKHTSFAVISLIVLAAFSAQSAYAVSKQTPQSEAAAPCAVLEKFGGPVRLLDATRTDVVDPAYNVGIACNGWVSIDGDGWALIRHANGYEFHLGSGSFMQIRELKDAKAPAEHVVLYQGSLFARVHTSNGELRVATANGRAKIASGSLVVTFSQVEEETQVIAVEKETRFENRFEPSRKIAVRAGEASTLGFRTGRVLPTAPRAISIASMRDKLHELGLEEKDYQIAIRSVRERQERKSVALNEASPKKGRSIASLRKSKNASYERHPSRGLAADNAVRNAMIKRVVGGEPEGSKILFPDITTRTPSSVGIQVRSIESRAGYQATATEKHEELEKKKLIEELSNMHPDL